MLGGFIPGIVATSGHICGLHMATIHLLPGMHIQAVTVFVLGLMGIDR